MKLRRSELVEILFESIAASGIPADHARAAASHPAARLSQVAAGSRLYIPIPDEKRRARDIAIRVAHGNGASIRSLARSFRMSKSRVHDILKRDPSALLS